MEKSVIIILSMYNGAKYIVDQLESLRQQTYHLFSLYIFDDCSFDNSFNIVQEYIVKYNLNEWHLYSNKQNKGWARNFMESAETIPTSAKYVFFCDQDDVWNLGKVKTMIDIMDSNQNISLLASDYILFFAEDVFNNRLLKENKRLILNNAVDKQANIPDNFYIRRPGCTFCAKYTLFKEASDLWTEDYPHDALLWKLSLSDSGLYIVYSPLINWRRHENNASTYKEITRSRRLREIHSDVQQYKAIICSSYENKKQSYLFWIKAYRFATFRYIMFRYRFILLWPVVFLFFRQYYVSSRACLGDLYLMFFKKYKVSNK